MEPDSGSNANRFQIELRFTPDQITTLRLPSGELSPWIIEAEVRIQIPGSPAELKGTYWITDDGFHRNVIVIDFINSFLQDSQLLYSQSKTLEMDVVGTTHCLSFVRHDDMVQVRLCDMDSEEVLVEATVSMREVLQEFHGAGESLLKTTMQENPRIKEYTEVQNLEGWLYTLGKYLKESFQQ